MSAGAKPTSGSRPRTGDGPNNQLYTVFTALLIIILLVEWYRWLFHAALILSMYYLCYSYLLTNLFIMTGVTDVVSQWEDWRTGGLMAEGRTLEIQNVLAKIFSFVGGLRNPRALAIQPEFIRKHMATWHVVWFIPSASLLLERLCGVYTYIRKVAGAYN